MNKSDFELGPYAIGIYNLLVGWIFILKRERYIGIYRERDKDGEAPHPTQNAHFSELNPIMMNMPTKNRIKRNRSVG